MTQFEALCSKMDDICTDSRRHDASDVVDLTVDSGEIVDLTSSCNTNNSVVRKSV